jgi:lipase maturation factor 1
MMWFAALGDCESSPWLLSLQEQLLRGGAGAAALFARDPFAHGAPRYLRTTTWQYRFSTPAQRKAGAPFWSRTREGPFCPPLTLVNGALRAVQP